MFYEIFRSVLKAASLAERLVLMYKNGKAELVYMEWKKRSMSEKLPLLKGKFQRKKQTKPDVRAL